MASSTHAPYNTQRLFHPDLPLPGLKQISNLLVDEAVRRSNGNQSLAARLLGISQPALNKRLKKRSEE